MFNSLAVLMFAVPLVCDLTFGTSAPTVIFNLSAMLVISTAMNFVGVRNQPDDKWVSAVAMLAAFMLLARQMPYMFDSPAVSSDFATFLVVVCGIAVSLVFGYMIKHVSNRFRTEGGLPSKPGRIYLVIKCPKSVLDYLTCVFGSPASSVSFCINGAWIKFKHRDGCAVLSSIEKWHGYEFIDTGLDATEDQAAAFLKVKGKPWTWRENCVTAWSGLTSDTMLEPKPWEWLPSLYVLRVLKELGK